MTGWRERFLRRRATDTERTAARARARRSFTGTSRTRSRRYGAHLRADDETPVERCFERETTAPSRHHVHGPARMGPEKELCASHPELAAGDFADLFIHPAQFEFADLEAHRSAPVAAASGEMKHDGSVSPFQFFDQLTSGRSHTNAGIHCDD